MTDRLGRISHGQLTGVGDSDSAVKAKSANAVGPTKERSEMACNLRLTETAERLDQLEQQLAKIPDMQADRVESYKRAIAEGRYRISSEVIADRLQLWERDLLGRIK